MSLRRTRLLTHAWIAILAIVLTVLAPAVNHLLPQAAAAHTLELCTSHGLKLVVDTGHPSGDPGQAGAGHCPYCGVHAASHAAIPPTPAVALATTSHASHPVLFYHSPRLLFAWTVASSRAPPVIA